MTRLAPRLSYRTFTVVLGLLFLTATGSEALARKDTLVVTLEYLPTEPEEVLENRGVIPVGGPPLEILLVADARTERGNVIGRNIEKGGDIPVRTTTNLAYWVREVLVESFRDWGTPSTPGAGLVVEPELLKLFVVEEHTYKAEVAMRFHLTRRDGTVIWAGIVGGSASRFGRSLKEENYQQVLSDALLSCISKFWADPGFRRAWATGKPVDTSGGEASKPTAAETLTPEAAMAKLLLLQEAGFDEDGLAAWVRRVDFTRPLSADDMIAWKKAGIPQVAIRAAME